jgi:hypothetical protein
VCGGQRRIVLCSRLPVVPSPRAFAHDARRAASHGVARAGDKASGRGAQRRARRLESTACGAAAWRPGSCGRWVRAIERPVHNFDHAFGAVRGSRTQRRAHGAAWKPWTSSTCWTAGAEPRKFWERGNLSGTRCTSMFAILAVVGLGAT